MSHQRRHGQTATVWITRTVTDNRGNEHIELDPDSAITVTAAFVPDRSARAEVPGQQQINVVKMIVAPIEGVNLWSRVAWDGKEWDVVTPPSYHHGTRKTRHYSLLLRERP